jgi:hypothetical protein
MTENDYYIAWGIYAVAALGCLLVWLRLTGWMWRWLREPLRVLGAALLLTPTVVDPAKDQYAPAVAISALDLLFKVAGNAWRAISDLAMYSVIALAAYIVFALVRWPLERSARARRAERQAVEERQAKLAEVEASAPFASAQVDTPGSGRYTTDPHPATGTPRRPPDAGLRVEPRL